ncbi:hypothetical protein MGN70_001936 [Eutypa lata]|nr:hypothetical protein MGN70_001936 [Eutypa lata]
MPTSCAALGYPMENQAAYTASKRAPPAFSSGRYAGCAQLSWLRGGLRTASDMDDDFTGSVLSQPSPIVDWNETTLEGSTLGGGSTMFGDFGTEPFSTGDGTPP